MANGIGGLLWKFWMGAAMLVAAVPVFLSSGPAHAQQIKIVALGGSSTFGQGVARSESYPAKLEAALRAKGLNVSVVNAGVSGDTSAGGLARVDSAAPAGTHIAIVELGVNDQGRGIDAATTRANIQKVVDRLRSRGTQVLLIGYRGSGNSLEGIAKAIGGRFMTFNFSGGESDQYRVANDPQKLTKGFAHFNGAGYDKIVGIMAPHIVALIGNPGKAN